MCTTQHGAILTIFPLYLQTTTIAQMLPIGGEGETDVQQGNHRLQTPPRVATRPKSSPVRPLAGNWYYCTQFTAKPKAACALRFSWAVTSSNLGL